MSTGECSVTSIYNPLRGCYELFIDRADPHIMIIDELLHQGQQPDAHPGFTVRRATEGHGSTGHAMGDYDCEVPAGGVCFHNAIVTIVGTNQTVIYRIGKYCREQNVWEASWPD